MIATSPEPVTSAAPEPAADDDDVILSVHGVSKHYKLWSSPSTRLRYSLLSQTHRTLRQVLPKQSAPLRFLQRQRERLYRDFTALHELSFEVRRGESLGIIGRNGAGKSTLLQLIAGTLQPSTGRVDVYGRIAALLELGSSFNPEFSGRENVYLNASILGFTEEATNEKFDRIAGFADIGQFLEQPVKTYSSGMMLRLAFSVQMALDPAIFIIDEALSVGDIYFQSKCNKLLRQKLDEGLTLLLVSHSTSAISTLCQRGLVLNRGQLAFLGPSEQAVNVYHELGDQRGEPRLGDAEIRLPEEENEEIEPAVALPPLGQIGDEIGSREIVITGCGLFNHQGQPCRDFAVGESIHAAFSFRSQIDIDDIMLGFMVRDKFNNPIAARTTANQTLDSPRILQGKTYTASLTLPGRLGHGEYLLDIGVGAMPDLVGSPQHHYHRVGGIAAFSVAWRERTVRFKGMCDIGAEFRWTNR